MTDSLQRVPNFFTKRSALTPPPFHPENVLLGEYGFLPYVRTGLAAAISEPPPDNVLRATVKASFEVRASDGPQAETVERSLTLLGPGDVTGIELAQVVRREPAPQADKVEETFLAHIEFDRPDYPWLFTPLPASGNELKPWLVLIVCDAEVTTFEPAQDQRPALLRTRKGELQSLEESHYFAHAQVVGAKTDEQGITLGLGPEVEGSVGSRLSDAHAPANLSRIVCPRRLAPNRHYIAALVPAFHCGLQTGLGLTGGTLGPAWTRKPNNTDADEAIVLPVYDSWEFRTGDAGDFRSLAEKLKGIAAPWEIGRRFIDVGQPGSEIPALAEEAPGRVEVLRCALYSPASRPPGAPVEASWPDAQRAALAQAVEQANQPDPLLPRVGPRLYARYQAASNRLRAAFNGAAFDAETADAWWFTQLNTTPAHRIVAGLGTRVVQKNQEALMQAAWAQVEGIRAANRALALAQLSEVLNRSTFVRRLEKLDLVPLAQLTRAVHARIKLTSQARTLAATVTLSQVADASTTLAFRRQVRPLGALARRAQAAGMPAPAAGLQKLTDQRVRYLNPDGITSWSDAALSPFSDETLGRVLGQPADRARSVLKQRLSKLGSEGGLFAQLATPGRVQVNPALNPGQAVAELVLKRLDRQLEVAPAQAAPALGVETAAGILAGFARSQQPAVSGRATARLESVASRAPAQSLRFRSELTVAPAAPSLTPVARPLREVASVAPQLAVRREAPLLIQNARPVAAAAERVPDQALVRFESPVSLRVKNAVAELSRVSPAAMATLLSNVAFGAGGARALTSELPPLTVTRSEILAQIEPKRRALQRFKGKLARETAFLNPKLLDRLGLAPVMAAPVFRRPMYQALHEYDREWLVPGLASLQQRDMVTLLKVNPAFCESFLIGLSDELGRELLWRDYPTDQRGTYFHRFWDAEQDELTTPIHRFAQLPLGAHYATGGAVGGGDRLVLVVRGELVARYPTLIAAAVYDRQGNEGIPEFSEDEVPILFQAHLPPDYLLVGFDLTLEALQQKDYWFLLAENPTAPRFGMAKENQARPELPPIKHDLLDWDDLTDQDLHLSLGRFLRPPTRTIDIESTRSKPKIVRWPSHAGIVARTLLRNPTRAAFQASQLIESMRAPR